MLSKESIQEFKKIFKEEFGQELDDQTAFNLARNTLNLFKVIYRPIKNGDGNENKNSDKYSAKTLE